MRTATAVIGAGYGDEGKGLLTDFLAEPGTTVVRTNGGAQAGHTVTTPDGVRHVFQHFGSGALRGAATHLSRFFVAHPMRFVPELLALAAKGARLDISVDPRTAVTTPYDMLVNQIVETVRGAGRHGSCGMGFGETVGRCLDPEFAILQGDLGRRDLRDRLVDLRERWLPRRLAELGVGEVPADLATHVASEAVLDRWLNDVAAYLAATSTRPDGWLGTQHVVFEGAQGLMLDQDRGAFPFVTRSNTGIANMAAVAEEAGIERIEAFYATRCYVTRHGAGPLAHEGPLEGFRIVDGTNVPNDWQGTLRFAPLDADVLARAVRDDLDAAPGRTEVSPSLVVTCLDQAPSTLPVVVAGVRSRCLAHVLPDFLAAIVGTDATGTWGPTRTTVAASRSKAA